MSNVCSGIVISFTRWSLQQFLSVVLKDQNFMCASMSRLSRLENFTHRNNEVSHVMFILSTIFFCIISELSRGPR